MQTLESRNSSLKAFDAGRFLGTAWALATTPDDDGDVILPSAFRKEIARATATGTYPAVRVKHVPNDVGRIEKMELDDAGLQVAGRFDLSNAGGAEAYRLVKSGELPNLSIGFEGTSELSGPFRIFTDIQLAEVSVCEHGKNLGARIRAVKAWPDCSSESDFRALLNASGMPHRLARKVAAIAWPTIDKHPEDEAVRKAALGQLLRVAESL